MSIIIIGDSAWQNEAGTNSEGGWNSAGSIWGNATSDTFTFASQTWVNEIAGNQTWIISGAGGADTVDFSGATATWSDAFNLGQLIQSGSRSTNTFAVIGSAYDDEFLWKGSAGAQISSFDGGGGTDTLSASASSASWSISFSTAGFQNLEYFQGSSLADKLGGSTAAETLDGGNGADSLWGAEGDDVLLGGAGADTYWFGAVDGADTIADDGNYNANDAVMFYSTNFSQLYFSRINSDTDVRITVISDQGYTGTLTLDNLGSYMTSNSSNRVNKFITNDISFSLSLGTSGADSLVGTALADYISGGVGADTLDGGLGGDAIYGEDGDDLMTYSATGAWLDGGSGTNTLTASSSDSSVTLLLGSSTYIVNFSVLEGSSLSDKLGGSPGDDTIRSGSGADSLWGGAGDDLLVGGTGADSYWFGIGDGADTIASSNTNNIDYVMFYGDGIGGGGIESTVVSDSNLTINMTTGDSLTLREWTLSSDYQLNHFDFGSAGVWSLSVDSDNTPTWTLNSG